MRPEDRYDVALRIFAEVFSLDWLLLKAQIKAESNFDPVARSSAGALGLSQFMPATFSEWSTRLGIVNPNPLNPRHSIFCQAAFFSWLLKQFSGDLPAALAAYNWGIGNVKRVAAAMGEAWKAGLPEETQNYLAKIEIYYDRYIKEEMS